MKNSLPERAHVVIVGAGVVGASVAYHLAKRGLADVLVLEQGEIGAQGATARCLGGLRTQFSTEINIRFSLLSREVFRRFEGEMGVNPDFLPLGYLFLAGTTQQWQTCQNTAGLMGRLGLPMELLEPKEISRRWPFINVADLQGASYTAEDGFYGPHEVHQGFVAQARRLGVKFRENTAVAGFEVSGARVTGVRTAAGELVKTDFTVLAAGPWSGQVAKLAGLDLPVGPLRRHLFFTEPFDLLPPAFPFIFDMQSGWYLRREGRGLILGGPPGEASFSERVDFEAEEWTAEKSLLRVPALERARIARGWVGHYELSPDHHAVVGAFPERPNLICATGFSGHGFQHSPATGMLVAELILDGRTTTLDIHPLRPTRFRENDLIHEPLTAFRE